MSPRCQRRSLCPGCLQRDACKPPEAGPLVKKQILEEPIYNKMANCTHAGSKTGEVRRTTSIDPVITPSNPPAPSASKQFPRPAASASQDGSDVSEMTESDEEEDAAPNRSGAEQVLSVISFSQDRHQR